MSKSFCFPSKYARILLVSSPSFYFIWVEQAGSSVLVCCEKNQPARICKLALIQLTSFNSKLNVRRLSTTIRVERRVRWFAELETSHLISCNYYSISVKWSQYCWTLSKIIHKAIIRAWKISAHRKVLSVIVNKILSLIIHLSLRRFVDK